MLNFAVIGLSGCVRAALFARLHCETLIRPAPPRWDGRYPVTGASRLSAAALMTVGLGLFGPFTGLLTSWVVQARQLAPTASLP